MGTSRLEAFSDGMMAIFITIMVLEFKVPEGASAHDLLPLVPKVLSYVLSFIYIGIYWNNHHHMFHAVQGVNGTVLWANLHLLFWLSLVPFTTAWMGENHFAPLPMALYGVVLLMAAIAYFILQRSIIRQQGEGSTVARAVGRDLKGRASPVLYLAAIITAFFSTAIAAVIYALVALMWLIPDRRFERLLKEVDRRD